MTHEMAVFLVFLVVFIGVAGAVAFKRRNRP
jgi:hypothetical protein